jgi:hypothetical protein
MLYNMSDINPHAIGREIIRLFEEAKHPLTSGKAGMSKGRFQGTEGRELALSRGTTPSHDIRLDYLKRKSDLACSDQDHSVS